MITHQLTWYESDDGKIFKDYEDCLLHEANFLYRKSGVRFYVGDKEVGKIIIDDDKTYNEITDIFINREKEEENKEFNELIRWDLGWLLIQSAIEGTGTHYQITDELGEDALKEVPS